MNPTPTTGIPIRRLSNLVELAFWWEQESEGLWLIYRNPGETEWRGGGLFFQMGADYIRFRGEEYLSVCLQQINARIRELWPNLFAPADVPSAFPAALVAAGPETVALVEKLAAARLVQDQLVQA